MNKSWYGLLGACSGIALLAGAVSLPETAHAQFGGLTGMIINHMLNGGHYYRGGGCGRGCRERHSGSSDNNSQNDHNDSAAERGAPSMKDEDVQLAWIASLNGDAIAAPTDEGTGKSVSPLAKAIPKEQERDWTKAIQGILNKLSNNQDKRVTTPGDVTEYGIEQSLEAAIRDSHLDRFETFLGENWTPERSRAMVLDLVSADVDNLFKGNSRGYARKQDVDQLIQNAAQTAYRRIFELSELLAANRSAALFLQRLYQTYGDRVNDDLRENAADMLTRAANAAIGGRLDVALRQESALSQGSNAYAIRYRAERIVFDCLLENVDKISSSETAMAEPGEIQHRLEATAKKQCLPWLEKQFLSADGRSITPQQPMPLRTVWSADGPKDDLSMYGQAINELR